ncbi:MAG: sugar phosphate nucleotidyltransferase [Candidatus Thorarchaeota archaeon]
MDAAILCGGEGTRLRPLTYAVPKPLLPLGSKPILEVTLTKMRDQGFKTFYLMTNYKSEMIRSYFGTGATFGVEIEYFEEKNPRGTAGPLSELKDHQTSPFVVMNADLLTNLRFKDLLSFHKNRGADLTIALKKFERSIAYGIVEIQDDDSVSSIEEKPRFSFLVNSGIYAVSPSVLPLIPNDGIFQMTDLIDVAISKGMNVVGYEFSESWRDIGRLDDYMKAISDIENGVDSDTEGLFI